MEEKIFLPVLHWFDANNDFTGSWGDFRFKVTPNVVKLNPKEVDFANSTLKAEYWHGPYCYDISEKEGTAEFPMSDEGREALRAWLTENI